MTTMTMIAACLTANLLVALALCCAPLGYQDKTGFHFGCGEEPEKG